MILISYFLLCVFVIIADLALDTRRGPGRASCRGPPYAGPLPQREPPSPAQSRRTTTQQQHQFDTLERRPSVSKMHRTASTADISEYKINEGAIKLLSVSDLILLIASLVMVATGIQWARKFKEVQAKKNS